MSHFSKRGNAEDVALCCVAPILAKTFRIMGLLKAANIYGTEAEAVQALNRPA